MPDLSTRRARADLESRKEPHWYRLGPGRFLGFYVPAKTWHARFRDRTGKQHWNPLEGVRENDYDEAVKAAQQWFSSVDQAATRQVKRGATVRKALEAYVADLRRQGREDAAKDAERRFRVTIWSDPLAEVELEGATRDDFRDWQERQRTPTLTRKLRQRSARTLNRHARSVAAGLNLAVNELGFVGNPVAWDIKPLVDDAEDEETAVFLTPDQRRTIISECEPFAARFVRGLELTGARPHELSKAKVSDFDGESLRLSHRKGKGAKLRSRHVVLDADGVGLFKVQAADKPAGALLFTEDGETQWRRHEWVRRIRKAIDGYNERVAKEDQGKTKRRPLLPEEASAYAFRHSRISELLQVYGIDPLTVAQQTGTSLAMIEKAYLKFIKSAMLEKLKTVKSGA